MSSSPVRSTTLRAGARQDWFPELWDRSLSELQDLFIAGPVAGTVIDEEHRFWFEFTAAAIASAGPLGIDFLLERAAKDDGQRLGAILSGLYSARNGGRRRRRQIREFLVGTLDSLNPGHVMCAIDTLRLLQFRDARPMVLPLLHRSSPYVVGAVLRYLSTLFPAEAIPHLMEGLKATEFPIRDCAIDCLDDLGYVAARPEIRPFLESTDWRTRQAATTAVEHLSRLAARSSPDAPERQ